MDSLDTLTARLEAAEEGSRELDAEIAGELGWAIDQQDLVGADKWLAPGDVHTQYLPKWTTSLDAALTLVPEGCAWQIRKRLDDGLCTAVLQRRKKPGGAVSDIWFDIWQDEEGATPALALCIAVLMACQAAPVSPEDAARIIAFPGR